MYIAHLPEIFNEAKRVLKKEGTLWLNIGDTYASTPAGNPDTPKVPGRNPISCGHKQRMDTSKCGIKSKCLCMIPERLAWSLIQDGWILRNKIVWYKPNAMPSSVRDRFSNKWEYVYMFSQGKKYYFDLDAIRERHSPSTFERVKYDTGHSQKYEYGKIKLGQPQGTFEHILATGKNPGDVFEISTQPFPEAHFAVFPEKLCEKPIKAGCPEEVCKKCGKAKTRSIKQEKINTRPGLNTGTGKSGKYDDPNKSLHNSDLSKYRQQIIYKTVGWTSCDCNAGFEPSRCHSPSKSGDYSVQPSTAECFF